MAKTKSHRQIVVRSRSGRATTGVLVLGNLRISCALGRGGLKVLKREGDGATPRGRFRLAGGFYRADRGTMRPRTGLALRPLRAHDGWCDEVGDRNYNRLVRHPYAASAERLWRADGLYDLVIVLGYNLRPRVQGRGSAIFLHVASAGFKPTQGCIALERADLVKLLTWLDGGASLTVV